MSTAETLVADKAMHVLIVDDDRDMLRLLQAAIKGHLGSAVSVQAVSSSLEAQQWLDGNLVDVLVTDLAMPGLSGLQLLRHAKRRNAWTQMIMVTGHSEHEFLTEAMDLGACDYLVKPLDLAELESVLREVQGRLKRWRRSLARTLGECYLLR